MKNHETRSTGSTQISKVNTIRNHSNNRERGHGYGRYTPYENPQKNEKNNFKKGKMRPQQIMRINVKMGYRRTFG